MKDSERLVWAAAFAQAMRDFERKGVDGVEIISIAIGSAFIAVIAFRRASEKACDPKWSEEGKAAWAMLKDMAGMNN